MTTCRCCLHWGPNNTAGDPAQHAIALCCRSRTMTAGGSSCPRPLPIYGRKPEQPTSTLPAMLDRRCITCDRETGPVASWGRTAADQAVGPCCAGVGDEYSPCLLTALRKASA